MTINVVFEDFEEMQAFASKLLGEKKERPASKAAKAQPAPAAQQAPSASITLSPPVVQHTQPAPAAQTVPATAPAQAVTPPQTVPVAAPQQPIPTAAPTYTLDDLARAAMTLMDAGRQTELQQLLARFGVEALPMLPQTRYGAFATELRGLGAQI